MHVTSSLRLLELLCKWEIQREGERSARAGIVSVSLPYSFSADSFYCRFDRARRKRSLALLLSLSVLFPSLNVSLLLRVPVPDLLRDRYKYRERAREKEREA